MTDDCYWKHRTPKEKLIFAWMEKTWFAPGVVWNAVPVTRLIGSQDVLLAGHRPGLSVTYTVPRKLICLESSWDERVFKNMSVRGFFDSLRPLIRSSPRG